MSHSTIKVLFVCLGNICRSPLAEGILVRDARRLGVDVIVDSAGTGSWHVGRPPDSRAIKVGEARGCQMTMRARQVRSDDFAEFDLIIPMDKANLSELSAWEGSQKDKLRLARSFCIGTECLEVPDPYYGDDADFESVADMLEDVAKGILQHIQSSSHS